MAKTQSNNLVVSWRKKRISDKRDLLIRSHNLEKQKMIEKFDERNGPDLNDSFTLGIARTGISTPVLTVPDELKKGSLVVSQTKKHISFMPDQHKPLGRVFKAEPSSQRERVEIRRELTAHDLVCIKVYPTTIQFSRAFVRSAVTRYMHVLNGTEGAILLEFDRFKLESVQVRNGRQVIPAGQSSSVEISLLSNSIYELNASLSYSINRQWEFEMQMTGSIIAVLLEVYPKTLKFSFPDQSEDFSHAETLEIKNNGNAIGYFSWEIPGESKFTVEQLEGSVGPNSLTQARVVYSPGEATSNRTDEARLVFRVKDGI
jgi:hypothetical protein